MGGARLGKGAHLLQPFYRVRHWGLRPFQKEGSILPALLTSLISNLISKVNGAQRVYMICPANRVGRRVSHNIKGWAVLLSNDQALKISS